MSRDCDQKAAGPVGLTGGVSPGELNVGSHPLFDLVYHGLSYLPVPVADASSLHSAAYVSWADRQFQAHGCFSAGTPSTLGEDAARMGALYADSRNAYLLHARPLLWDDLGIFMHDVREDMRDIPWNTPARRRLAESILNRVNPILVDLFRTARWTAGGLSSPHGRDREVRLQEP